jgi:hypothetical protein
MTFPLRLLAISLGAFLYLCASATNSFAKPPGNTSKPTAAPPRQTVAIPGPLRSFERMAGISQKIEPEDVLPLLAHNIFLQGYQENRPTEFLILIDRYMHQARELQALAGSSGTIAIPDCEHAGQLLAILGYRMRGTCGQKDLYVSTASPERAFLTIDSGFPLTSLETAIRNNTRFTYTFPISQVPVLLSEADWLGLGNVKEKGNGNLIDVMLHDPSICRLYWAFSRIDSETQATLVHSAGLRKLLPYAAVMDFYGSEISIQNGRVLVPGGEAAEPAWKDLVGASPTSPGDFVTHLLAKDDGWLAVYYDAIARVDRGQQAHLTEASRLKHMYEGFRWPQPDEKPGRAVFRKATPLLVLFTRLQWEPDGQPHVPGNLDVWKEIFAQKTNSKIVHEWSKRSRRWNRPDQLIDAIAACSRISTDEDPLRLYLTLSELDRVRPRSQRLTPETVRVLANKYYERARWYLIFAEFPELDQPAMIQFVKTANSIDNIPHVPLRGNALGIFQANLGLWQILARQHEIPRSHWNDSWQSVVSAFSGISSESQLLDAAQHSVRELFLVSTGKQRGSQEELVELLAGPQQKSLDGERMHAELAGRIRAVIDDQRLVSLDTLFALSEGIEQMEHGAQVSDKLIPLAQDLRGFELPQQIFTRSEKIEWAPTIYTSRHAELQIRTDMTKVLKNSTSRTQLELARGQLTPFVRDTLVGLNYAYYEPPGAQILHNNPLLVRSHDFSGFSIAGAERPWDTPQLFGIGIPAGGGAYLIGSLSDLPYALAMSEQDFIAPANVQALIWKEVVPHLLVSATLPRWWNISSDELHAVTLYQRSGEEMLTASMKDEALREKVLLILSERMDPLRLQHTADALRQGTTPMLAASESFYLASEFPERYPQEDLAALGPENRALATLRRDDPTDTTPAKIAHDFGTPHPTMGQNYAPELLNGKPFPASGGEESRLFGESCESTNLYWARLADEMGYAPVMLNWLIPELTRRMVANIFATDFEDWAAVQRAMQETGTEFRQGRIASQMATSSSPGH